MTDSEYIVTLGWQSEYDRLYIRLDSPEKDHLNFMYELFGDSPKEMVLKVQPYLKKIILIPTCNLKGCNNPIMAEGERKKEKRRIRQYVRRKMRKISHDKLVELYHFVDNLW